MDLKITKITSFSIDLQSLVGKPGASLDALPDVSISDKSLGSVSLDKDGFVVVTPTGVTGKAQVTISGLIGGKPISHTEDVNFIAAIPVKMSLGVVSEADNLTLPADLQAAPVK